MLYIYPTRFYIFYTALIEVGHEFSAYTTMEGDGVVSISTLVENFPGGSPRPLTTISLLKMEWQVKYLKFYNYL